MQIACPMAKSALLAAVCASVLAAQEPRPRPEGRPEGRRGGPPAMGTDFFTSSPAAKDDFEKKTLGILDDLYRNQRQGMMNVPPDDGRILRLLVEFCGARHVVEIGTSNGYSGLWICLALHRTNGKLTTFDIDEGRFALARENFRRAGVSERVTQIFGDAHKEVAKVDGPIDVLFLDADKSGYLDYLNQLLPKVRPGGLIIAHNITPQQADPRYVKAITENPELESLLLSPQRSSISVTLKKR